MDCVFVAIAALKLIGITLATVPSVVVTDAHGRGEYTPNVIYVKDVSECYVYVHEFIHHKQYLVTKRIPKTLAEYWLWEREAAMLTMHAMAEYQEAQQGKGEEK